MERIAFKMKLKAGFANEYRNRHDKIWQDLMELLKKTGIEDYSIFLDEETNALFGVLSISDKAKLEDLSTNPVMRHWWDYMKDIMETNSDNSPVNIPLKEMFYLA